MLPRVRPRVEVRMAVGGELISPTLRSLLTEAAQRELARPTSRSATRALGDALLAGHFLLRDRNAVSLPEERQHLSAAGAVHGPQGAYVALAGRAYALRLGAEHQQAVLAGPEALPGGIASSALHPLGGASEPRLTLQLLPLDPGERLVLGAGSRQPTWLPSPGEPPPRDAGQLARLLRSHENAQHVVVLDSDLRVLADEPGPAAAARLDIQQQEAERPVAPAPLRAAPLTAAMAVLVLLLLGLGLWASQPTGEPAPGSLEQVGQLLQEAERAADGDQAVELVRRADNLVVRIGEERVPAELRVQLRQVSDRAHRVERLGEARPLVLDDGRPSPTLQMELSGEELFLLDADGSVRAAWLSPDSSPVELAELDELVSPGQPLGGEVVGHPVAMAWVPDGRDLERSVLVVVDTERTIIGYHPGIGLSRTRPPESDRWMELGPMAGAEGAVYLVDRGRGLMLEYPMTTQGSFDPPRVVLSEAETELLPQVVDLAVSGEDIYLLLQDGRVVRYDLDGRSLPFPALMPDQPISEPTALGLGRRSGGVYVADVGNDRIVHFSREGALVRQLQSAEEATEPVADLRGVRVDEPGGLLVCLTPRGVVKFDLPP